MVKRQETKGKVMDEVKDYFAVGGEGISLVPVRPSGSGNETEDARMTIRSDLK